MVYQKCNIEQMELYIAITIDVCIQPLYKIDDVFFQDT